MTTTTDHTITPSSAPAPELIAELRAAVQNVEDVQADHTGSAPKTAAPAPKTAVNKDKPELPAYLLAMIALVGIVTLTLTHNAVPDVLNLVAIGSIGIAGAVTNPSGRGGPHPPSVA